MKKAIAVLLSFSITLSSLCGNVFAQTYTSPIIGDELPTTLCFLQEEKFDVVMFNERVYVPLNIFRTLQINNEPCQVTWDSNTKTANIQHSNFRITINNKGEVTYNENSSIKYKCNINDGDIHLINLYNQLYVPLSLLCDKIGIDVIWNSDEKTVTVPGTMKSDEPIIPEENFSELDDIFANGFRLEDLCDIDEVKTEMIDSFVVESKVDFKKETGLDWDSLDKIAQKENMYLIFKFIEKGLKSMVEEANVEQNNEIIEILQQTLDTVVAESAGSDSIEEVASIFTERFIPVIDDILFELIAGSFKNMTNELKENISF